VDREKFGKLEAFVAQPLRALVDLVALRKERWSGLDWLTMGEGHGRHGMRRMPPQEGGRGTLRSI